jgi:hypothetical protein
VLSNPFPATDVHRNSQVMPRRAPTLSSTLLSMLKWPRGTYQTEYGHGCKHLWASETRGAGQATGPSACDAGVKAGSAGGKPGSPLGLPECVLWTGFCPASFEADYDLVKKWCGSGGPGLIGTPTSGKPGPQALGNRPGMLRARRNPVATGPYLYTGRGIRDAHFDLKISPEVFDEVTAELINAMDDFNVPEREKQEVLAAFGAEKGEVTAGSQPGQVNWRSWH